MSNRQIEEDECGENEADGPRKMMRSGRRVIRTVFFILIGSVVSVVSYLSYRLCRIVSVMMRN